MLRKGVGKSFVEQNSYMKSLPGPEVSGEVCQGNNLPNGPQNGALLFCSVFARHSPGDLEV
jgi:hypothetical protein